MAISKFAAVKTSSVAEARPLFCPMPERSNSPIKEIRIEQEDDEAYFDDRSPDAFSHW
jgi:hypothetical protein